VYSHRGIIRYISYNPFYCFYWTEEQRVLYKNACNDKGCFLAIGATGGIVNKLFLPKKEIVVFISLSLHTSKDNFPAFQMISK